MIIACVSCGSKYKYDEAKLQGALNKRIKCPKCKSVIEVLNPQFGAKKSGTKNPVYNESLAMEQTYTAVPRNPSNTAVREQSADDDGSNGPVTAQVKRESLLAEVAVRAPNDHVLQLPEYRRYSLAVIQGYNSGEIFQITKPRMIIGRMDSDVVVKDLEASRQHARIDVVGDRVILRDLNSTNGTFVNEQRIATVNLDNQQEFRIGTTVFMLIITEIE